MRAQASARRRLWCPVATPPQAQKCNARRAFRSQQRGMGWPGHWQGTPVWLRRSSKHMRHVHLQPESALTRVASMGGSRRSPVRLKKYTCERGATCTETRRTEGGCRARRCEHGAPLPAQHDSALPGRANRWLSRICCLSCISMSCRILTCALWQPRPLCRRRRTCSKSHSSCAYARRSTYDAAVSVSGNPKGLAASCEWETLNGWYNPSYTP